MAAPAPPAATVDVQCPCCHTPITVSLGFEIHKVANSTMLMPFPEPPLDEQVADHKCQEPAGRTLVEDWHGKALHPEPL